jgi:hypothetical protein
MAAPSSFLGSWARPCKLARRRLLEAAGATQPCRGWEPMILQIARWARWLDEWLQTRLGRPYNVLLGIGLITEIIEQVSRLPQKLESAPNLLRSALVLLVEFALLLHQIGALSHHVEHRGLGRRRGGRAKPADANES